MCSNTPPQCIPHRPPPLGEWAHFLFTEMSSHEEGGCDQTPGSKSAVFRTMGLHVYLVLSHPAVALSLSQGGWWTRWGAPTSRPSGCGTPSWSSSSSSVSAPSPPSSAAGSSPSRCACPCPCLRVHVSIPGADSNMSTYLLCGFLLIIIKTKIKTKRLKLMIVSECDRCTSEK